MRWFGMNFYQSGVKSSLFFFFFFFFFFFLFKTFVACAEEVGRGKRRKGCSIWIKLCMKLRIL